MCLSNIDQRPADGVGINPQQSAGKLIDGLILKLYNLLCPCFYSGHFSCYLSIPTIEAYADSKKKNYRSI